MRLLLVGLFVDHGGDYGGAITIQKWGETSCTSGAAKQIVDSGLLVHPNLCTFYHALGIDYIKPILFGHIIVPFQLLGDHSLGPAVWCMDIGLTLKLERYSVSCQNTSSATRHSGFNSTPSRMISLNFL